MSIDPAARALAAKAMQNAGGNVSNVGTPTNGQIAQWTGAQTIQGAATTGSGAVVLATSPTLTTPTIGAAIANSVNKVAITPPATIATLTIADGKTLAANNSLTLAGVDSKTLTVNNSLTLAGTDATTQTFPSTSQTIAGLGVTQTWTAAQTFPASGIKLTSPGGGVWTFAANSSASSFTLSFPAVTAEVTAQGNLTTGTGNLVLATSPSLTTPALSGETFSVSAAVTAGTDAQGQGALTSDVNVITTTSANPSGVTLPTATTGRRVKVIHRGTNPVNIYPATGAAINALAANAAIRLDPNAEFEFDASSATQWFLQGLGGNGPAFFAYRNAAFSLATPTANNKIPCDTTTFNVGGGFSTATGTFTAPVAGYYLFMANVQSNATGEIQAEIWKAGSLYAFGIDYGSGTNVASSVFTFVQLALGDTVDFYSWNGTAGSLALYVGSAGYRTYFCGALIRGA